MKKENNKIANQIYNLAKDNGLDNIANMIKSQYKVSSPKHFKISELISEEMNKDKSTYFDSIIHKIDSCVYYVLWPLFSEFEKNEQLTQEKEALMKTLFTCLINGDTMVKNKTEALDKAKWNFSPLNDYMKKALTKLGYIPIKFKDLAVTAHNNSNICYICEDISGFCFHQTWLRHCFSYIPQLSLDAQVWVNKNNI